MEKCRRFFDIVYSSRGPRTGSPSCQCSMAFCENPMIRIASRNAEKVENYAKKFLPGHCTILGPGSEKRWYCDSHGGQWDCTANKIEKHFKETGHPIFTSASALSRGILKQRIGKSTVHLNGDSVNMELLLQTVHSVNQISIYAAVTD